MRFPADRGDWFWELFNDVINTRGWWEMGQQYMCIIPEPVLPGDEISSGDVIEKVTEQSIDVHRHILIATLTNVLKIYTKETIPDVMPIGVWIPRGKLYELVGDDMRNLVGDKKWIYGHLWELSFPEQALERKDDNWQPVMKVPAGYNFASPGCTTLVVRYDPVKDTPESYLGDINNALLACILRKDKNPHLYIQVPKHALLDAYKQIIIDGLGEHSDELRNRVQLYEIED